MRVYSVRNLTKVRCFKYFCFYFNGNSFVEGAAVMVLDDGDEKMVYKERERFQDDLATQLGAESFVLEDAAKRGSLLNLLVSVGTCKYNI
ncbi:MAG: hypothetical protein ACK50N_01290 [Flavobacteriales bacterium]|jgi:hypothetical protein